MIALSVAFPLGEVTGRFPFTDNGRRIVLTQNFAYVDAPEILPFPVTIAAGFESDFNSTPQFLWGWFPPWECPEAGLVHDWLYQHPGAMTRAQIDRVHRRIMELKGERPSKCYTAWLGIRSGGWHAWNEYRAGRKPIGMV